MGGSQSRNGAAPCPVPVPGRSGGAVDALVLFSGGLDSILAARLLMEQGLRVRCLHCVSPFFGDAQAVAGWSTAYGLDIESLDVTEDFVAMLRQRPAHGFGKVMNPCVDCKILLLSRARRHMQAIGAGFLATGEVMGQRPMSQRRDTMHLIPREAGVNGLLLRPLCAKLLPPIPAEENGLVDRGLLLDISGRGRTRQLELAAHFGLVNIPTPAGGCRLTEKENARRYWPVLTRRPAERLAHDLALANPGRQLWAGGGQWLVIGRNHKDNEHIRQMLLPEDVLLELADFTGPLALCREGTGWPRALLAQAAGLMASYAPRAVEASAQSHSPVRVLAHAPTTVELAVMPSRTGTSFAEPLWDTAHAALREEARQRQMPRQTS